MEGCDTEGTRGMAPLVGWPCRQRSQTGRNLQQSTGALTAIHEAPSGYLLCTFPPLSLSLLPCSLLVSNRHHFFDSDILYHFWINFRRRRRLTELLNENSSRALSESPDSPFCLRKLNPEPGNTSFLSGNLGVKARVLLAEYPRDEGVVPAGFERLL